LEDSQAAGFSGMPSMKTVPLMTSASSGEPFNPDFHGPKNNQSSDGRRGQR
jgi:hypothetical protein